MLYICLDTKRREENSLRGKKKKRGGKGREGGKEFNRDSEKGWVQIPRSIAGKPGFPLLCVEGLLHCLLAIKRLREAIGLGNTQSGRPWDLNPVCDLPSGQEEEDM